MIQIILFKINIFLNLILGVINCIFLLKVFVGYLSVTLSISNSSMPFLNKKILFLDNEE